MLDNTTKQKINTLRDILVGKVSDPKSQVEQITIALFYKFMEDMDNELINDLGAEAKFFSGKYAKYSWKNLFAPSLGGEDMLNLYREAVEGMEINPNIPSAFRDIFKRAYLPYNDPATLRMFLKVVDDGFHYAHSEMLGDAFEYLLSILGTQGDAGQFRTPRHIIDFIAACVNPQKEDVICDPACGTAGFVIAAYKHILKQNTKNNSGDLLSPDDKKRIAQNLIGLDIDPMMVKLALANMYLHGFQDPHIYEYDSLTSEDRWADTYDVVLANPPFMTPKGGIRPHKRFTTQATKAEVLFVDLISTHLTANGRAGIIVPNGIVATSQTAYKNLRKLLVNDSLIAVISLPAGVFQPYSGVKTSILILDKVLCKKSDSVLFIKVENDGFDLGSQRREIVKNDLPMALKSFNSYKESVLLGKPFDNEKKSSICTLVEKEKIISKKDIILSSDRYFVDKKPQNTIYELVKIGEILKLTSGKFLPKKDFVKGNCKVYGGNGVTGTHNKYLVENETIVIGRVGEYCGTVHLTKPKSWVTDNCLMVNEYLKEVNNVYLKYILNKTNLNQYAKVGGQPSISQSSIYELEIPLPSLKIQEEIAKEIVGFQKIIDGAKMVVENYKPTISIKPDWEIVELGSVCEINKESNNPKKLFNNENFCYLDVSSIENGTGLVDYSNIISSIDAPSRARRVVKNHDILLSTVRPNLKAFGYLMDIPNRVIASTGFAVLTATDKILPKYLHTVVFQENVVNQMISRSDKGQYPSITQKDVSDLIIPLPPIEEQQAIVAQIEVEQKIVDANKQLIEIYEQKIQNRIALVWGDE